MFRIKFPIKKLGELISLSPPRVELESSIDSIFEILFCTGMGKKIYFRAEYAAKNTHDNAKCFKQKLFGIKFSAKNSVEVYLYLPQEWS